MLRQMTLTALLCSVLAASLAAQTTGIETFLLLQKTDTILVRTAVTDEKQDLPLLNGLLGAENFPSVTLSRRLFGKIVEINNRRNTLTESLLLENLLWRERDTLNRIEIATLRQLDAVNRTQISACEQTNENLNQSIQSLNLQLTETRQLARDANKNTFGKRAMGIVLGGGIGLGLGILLGVIVAK